MRKRVETVALAQEDAPDSGGAKAAGGARRGAALLANGKDTAQLEAITLMDWDMALGGTQGTLAGGLLLGDGSFANDLASDLFIAPSLDPTSTTSLNPSLTAGRGGRHGGRGAAANAASSGAAGTLAAALAGGGRGGARWVGQEGAGVDMFEAEGFGFGAEAAEEQLLAMDHANEVFDVAPDFDIFGADLQEMLAPPSAAEDEPPMDEPPPFDADPEAGADQQPPGSCQADPSALADGAANGDAGSGAAEKAHVVAGSRKRGVKRRVNAPVVDPPTDLQISNSTYREWIKDSSRITITRPLRRGGGADGLPPGADGSPTAKNNAAAGREAWSSLLPASAFAAGLIGLATGGPLAWGDDVIAAFRLCAGDRAGAPARREGGDAGATGAGALGFEEALRFRGDGGGGGGAAAAAQERRAGGAGGGREDAARAAKRARFGDLPLEQEEGAHYDMEELPLDPMFEERNDTLGDLAFGGDIETERLRAAAPTPGASGDSANPLLRARTPGSSLGAGGGGAVGNAAAVRRAGREQRSGSETGSLLGPESVLRSDLRGRRRGGGLEGFLIEVVGPGAGLVGGLPLWLREDESPLARMGGRRSGSAGGSLRDLLPDVVEEAPQDEEMPEGEPPSATLPSSQWQLLVESGTQHVPRPEDSMNHATHTAIKVFRSRLLEASRRGAGSISFLAIARRLSRAEAAKAFYQVCVTNATGHIKATQAQPFNDIQIAAGPQM
ncbi:hypothetical protein MNEG_7718 [Monoraphidium neglectum]|uniref:Rad21/Rec8-like protein C-terminal eukaryotic domain-containing protein n=1 Tax=Monoraphidium neglectum TaxID=145388 RepID=A0A0D2KYE2_9CHLO|nr:hypothetical protein MNEG_7718 [Monoraphidium neglectum]KIZ00244.1 hypothetical protein MNEG_7718 [Monoraphidium neglectum]|eukprot:XP_013899263.1 hypothetical protein MNEG_7718 [Monoraphidium neglectum]